MSSKRELEEQPFVPLLCVCIPALEPSTRVRVAMRGQPNPPEGRSVIRAQHICVTPTSSFTGAVGAISKIVASVKKNCCVS